MSANETAHPDRRDAGFGLARALFAPERIVLIGASAQADKLASRPLRVLRRHGFSGVVECIDGSPATLDALRRATSRTAGAPITHALIMTAATGVAQAIEACGAGGIRVATVLSAGFAELGARGKRRQDALLETARRSGVRLLGPNSLGIVNVAGRVALSANAVFEREPLERGGVSVVSQSGSMLGAIVTRAQDRGVGFSKLVAVGNESDIAVGELVDLLVDDPETNVVLLFLEALRDAPRLAAAARRAFAAGKPVIAYKTGRSAATRELALTHTGALSDEHQHAQAFFREHGILGVDVFEALFEMPNLVLGRRPLPRGRLATLTVSGGAAAMVLDGLRGHEVEIAPATDDVVARLNRHGVRCNPGPIIDLPMGRADQGAYAAALATLLDSDHCDLVLAVQGSNATHMPESVHERILAVGAPRKPLAVFMGPRADEASRILHRHGIAAFRTPEACADAIRACCAWRTPEPQPVVDPATRAAIADAVARLPRGALHEADAGQLLRAVGIEVAPAEVVRSPAAQVTIGFPVAAKLLSRAIPHRTDVGGVRLDIPTPEALREAIGALLQTAAHQCPHAELDGVLVQTMQYGIAEVLVGYRHSPEVGPIVVLGLGGGLAELAADCVVRCAPLTRDSARAMVDALPAMRLLRGFRNRPAGDADALAEAIHRLSLLALADAPRILETEINPLIVKPQGVVAVDALARIDDRPA